MSYLNNARPVFTGRFQTKDWSRNWLNDRDLARRPWVFDKQYEAVDKLLADFAPHFADRMLSEEYTVKYLLDTNAHAAQAPQ